MKQISVQVLHDKYGIRRQLVSELVRAGFIAPARGARREYQFSFHDVVMLRMAQDLYAAGISARKLSRFLKQLASVLPAGSTAGIRVSAAGRELVVRQDGRLRNLQGQLVLDFSGVDNGLQARLPVQLHHQVSSRTGRYDSNAGDNVNSSGGAQATHLSVHGLAAQLEQAEASMESDPAAAMLQFCQLVQRAPDMSEAWINLVYLLIQAQRIAQAHTACLAGLQHCPQAALLHFNLGIVLEEMQQPAQALQCYRHALRCDAQLADAHFNAARLCESSGDKAGAIRHYNAYRRSQNK